MARARLLKPGFFKNEDLASLPFESRLCFAGLWVLADREGRLEDRPRRLKADIFPYDNIDMDALLWTLVPKGFILRYCCDNCSYIAIVKFASHQSPHIREPKSDIPSPHKTGASIRPAPVWHQSSPTTLKKEEKKVIQRKEERNLDPDPDPVIDPETETVGRAPNGNGAHDVNARSRHPIFKGQRIVVFDWMLEDLSRMLGEHTNAFHLDEWFYELDLQALKSGCVIPQRDKGVWIQAQTLAEAHRRGLPIATTGQLGKQSTRILSMLAKFKAEDQRDTRKLR